jgi:hypothetical protein
MHVLASAQETSTRLKELPVDWTFWIVQVAPPSVLLTTDPPLTAMRVWAFGMTTLESEFPWGHGLFWWNHSASTLRTSISTEPIRVSGMVQRNAERCRAAATTPNRDIGELDT